MKFLEEKTTNLSRKILDKLRKSIIFSPTVLEKYASEFTIISPKVLENICLKYLNQMFLQILKIPQLYLRMSLKNMSTNSQLFLQGPWKKYIPLFLKKIRNHLKKSKDHSHPQIKFKKFEKCTIMALKVLAKYIIKLLNHLLLQPKKFLIFYKNPRIFTKQFLIFDP